MKLKNETCEIEITRNPRGESERANQYYGVNLVSGAWPSDSELIAACDNGAFGGLDRTFGGSVRSEGSKNRYVTVYVD